MHEVNPNTFAEKVNVTQFCIEKGNNSDLSCSRSIKNPITSAGKVNVAEFCIEKGNNSVLPYSRSI